MLLKFCCTYMDSVGDSYIKIKRIKVNLMSYKLFSYKDLQIHRYSMIQYFTIFLQFIQRIWHIDTRTSFDSSFCHIIFTADTYPCHRRHRRQHHQTVQDGRRRSHTTGRSCPSWTGRPRCRSEGPCSSQAIQRCCKIPEGNYTTSCYLSLNTLEAYCLELA